jgi:hypothetical protein
LLQESQGQVSESIFERIFARADISQVLSPPLQRLTIETLEQFLKKDGIS